MDQPEHRLSHYCIELLDRIILTDVPHHWTAIDHAVKMSNQSPQAKMNFENHRKWTGIKPHHLDIYIYQMPLFSQIELKFAATRNAAEKAITTGQGDTIKVLSRQGIQTAFAWTVRSFYEALKQIGFRLHGNAENIVTEVEARYEAAQRAAELKTVKPRKLAKPRADKPSAAKVRKMEAIRARVLF